MAEALIVTIRKFFFVNKWVRSTSGVNFVLFNPKKESHVALVQPTARIKTYHSLEFFVVVTIQSMHNW